MIAMRIRSKFFGGNEVVIRLKVSFVVWCFGKVFKASLTDIVALWSSLHKDFTIQIPANDLLIRSTVNFTDLVLRNSPPTHLIIQPFIEGKWLNMILLHRGKAIF